MFKQEGDEAAVLTALSPTLVKYLCSKGSRNLTVIYQGGVREGDVAFQEHL